MNAISISSSSFLPISFSSSSSSLLSKGEFILQKGSIQSVHRHHHHYLKSSNGIQEGAFDNDNGDDLDILFLEEETKKKKPQPLQQQQQQKSIIEEFNTISSISKKRDDSTKSTMNANKEQQQQQKSPYMVQNETVVGIGGKGGYIYDINHLKSNLVQKSIKQFKMELLKLLITPSNNKERSSTTTTATTTNEINKHDKFLPVRKSNVKNQFQKQQKQQQQRKSNRDLVDEKISALVSTNPVSTTTDSNLLEGEWEFAYSTSDAEKIMEDSRVVLAKSKKATTDNNSKKSKGSNNKLWRLKPTVGKSFGSLFTSWKRDIYLESLENDEDPYMIDSKLSYNGLVMTNVHYKVVGVSTKKRNNITELQHFFITFFQSIFLSSILIIFFSIFCSAY